MMWLDTASKFWRQIKKDGRILDIIAWVKITASKIRDVLRWSKLDPTLGRNGEIHFAWQTKFIQYVMFFLAKIEARSTRILDYTNKLYWFVVTTNGERISFTNFFVGWSKIKQSLFWSLIGYYSFLPLRNFILGNFELLFWS